MPSQWDETRVNWFVHEGRLPEDATKSGAWRDRGAQHKRHGIRVLIAEESWSKARLITGILSDAGYDVIGPVATPTIAAAMVAEDHVDAALLGIGLADGNTFSLAGFLNGWGVPFGLLANGDAPDIPPHLRDHPLVSQPISVKAVLNVMSSLSGGGEGWAPVTVSSAR